MAMTIKSIKAYFLILDDNHSIQNNELYLSPKEKKLLLIKLALVS